MPFVTVGTPKRSHRRQNNPEPQISSFTITTATIRDPLPSSFTLPIEAEPQKKNVFVGLFERRVCIFDLNDAM
ncbi:hypothetical protein HanIR_Chr11g0510721 [Helianthus annuus]|nr:hypothetical protein HanIR_Chr11g0510721 [Helianthus annuus]